jgi:hypothetical protein
MDAAEKRNSRSKEILGMPGFFYQDTQPAENRKAQKAGESEMGTIMKKPRFSGRGLGNHAWAEELFIFREMPSGLH